MASTKTKPAPKGAKNKAAPPRATAKAEGEGKSSAMGLKKKPKRASDT